MCTDQRFTLDEDSYVIDSINPANSRKVQADGRQEERYLRERILMIRLNEIVDKLIIKKHFNDRECQPGNEETHSI